MRVNGLEQRQGEVDQKRDGQTIQADTGFEEGVYPERMAAPVDPPSSEKTAQRKAGHERGENRGNRIMGVAEHQGELAGPDHFINKARRPGYKKQKERGDTEWMSGQ